MAIDIGSLLIRLGLDSGEFKSGLTESERELKKSVKNIQKIGQGLTDIGTKMTLAVTAPIIAIGQKAVAGFVEQERAIADVTAALKSMGGVSGKTAAELSKAADAMEMDSLFDAEVILKQVTANLLTFGKVAGTEFDRAQQAAIDMATRLGGEPQAAAIMLGKALNDPVKGITALTRVGVQFSAQQKKQIEEMAKAGETAKAQGIILAEVERQFSGAAKAAADATPWRKAQVAMGQAMDVIGEAILPLIKPVAEGIASIARAFAALPESGQKAIVIIAGLAAAVGPLLMAIGGLIQFAAPMLGVFSVIASSMQAAGGAAGALQVAMMAVRAALAVLAPALGPIALAIGAAYLAWKNWDSIAPILQALWATLSATIGPPLMALIDSVRTAFTAFWNGPLGADIRAAAALLVELGKVIMSALGAALPGIIKALGSLIGGVFSMLSEAILFFTALLSGDFEGAFEHAWNFVKAFATGVTGIFAGLAEAVVGYVSTMVGGIARWIGNVLQSIWDSLVRKIKWVGDAFFNLYDAVVGHSYIPDMVDEIGQHMSRLDQLLVGKAKDATGKAGEAFRELASNVQSIMQRLYPEMARLLAMRNDLATIDKGEKAGLLSPGAASDARFRVRQEGAGISGDAAVSGGLLDTGPIEVAAVRVGDILTGMGDRAQEQTVRVAKSFKDMAEETLGALRRLTDAIKGGGFLGILEGVIGLGLQLGGIGAFGKKIQSNINRSIPGYATGTGFHPGGLAVVGERGPELVSMPRGSQVFTNAESRAMARGGGGNKYYFSGNLMTPEFWARINAGDMAAANGGAQLAGHNAAMAQSRRLG